MDSYNSSDVGMDRGPEWDCDAETPEGRVEIGRLPRLPLFPRRRHGIELVVVTGDGPRFVEAFQETWRRVPLWARRYILGHWRAGGDLVERREIWASPSIMLTYKQILYREGCGSTWRHGYELMFAAEDVADMPDSVAQDLIAHELIHVLQASYGIRARRNTSSDGPTIYEHKDGSIWGDVFQIEEDADATMEAWGFDPESIDEWAIRTGRARVETVGLTKETWPGTSRTSRDTAASRRRSR